MDVRTQGFYSTEEELSYMLLLASHRDGPPHSKLIKVKAVSGIIFPAPKSVEKRKEEWSSTAPSVFAQRYRCVSLDLPKLTGAGCGEANLPALTRINELFIQRLPSRHNLRQGCQVLAPLFLDLSLRFLNRNPGV
ncbi:hypothetical protein PO909_019377 [Leuciscus waleckii]